MKLKIASVIMGIAILVLGVAIYKLHTKETPATPVEIKREEPPVKAPEIRPPVIKPKPPEPVITCPEPVRHPLEVKQGHIIKR